MIEMSPYYAHQSPVGPVFDVATWSPRKALTLAIVCLIVAVVFTSGAVYAWDPGLVFDRPPKALKTFNREIADLKKEHPWGTGIGIGVLGLIGYLGLAGACSGTVDFLRGGYYFRAGAAGISLRVPNGLDFKRLGLCSGVLQLDLRLAEVAKWGIVQRKRAGALSRDAGNISAHFNLKTVHGAKHQFSLDYFREPARIIARKLEDALQMVPARLGGPDFGSGDSGQSGDRGESEESTASAIRVQGAEDRFDAIFAALARLVSGADDQAAVVVAEPSEGKFVQFASVDGSLLFDLPAPTLDESEMLRAVEYFRRMGQEIREYRLLDAPGGRETSTQRSFQVNVGTDAGGAARLALDVFDHVYGVPADSPLVVEQT